ncbi:Glycoside hydrolase family 76 protein [Mycena indigotica]|uniref:Glycoside hydrolase family 76 protein n=1 Tax=Mycena indigotica TaxID=2126181 RepID=A0A8H6W5K3_9AGAR|nr:Glycoside hydrolase family 76 protein [Mycena indigotica]KAF7303646.1 Glycoside hydrolase family 76 protein [Mycena indigotica]
MARELVLVALLSSFFLSTVRASTNFTTPLPSLSQRTKLANDGIVEALGHIGSNGLFPGQPFDLGAKFYIILAEYDLSMNETKYQAMLTQYFAQALQGRPHFDTGGSYFSITLLHYSDDHSSVKTFDSLQYGFAAMRAYEAYKDQTFLNYALDVWSFIDSMTLSQQNVDSGSSPPKNLTIRGTCKDQSLLGGTFISSFPNGSSIMSSTVSALFAILSIHLASATSDSSYLTSATNSIGFIERQLYSPTQAVDLVMQQVSATTCSLDQSLFPYNSGFVIEAICNLLSFGSNSELQSLLHDIVDAATTSAPWMSTSTGVIKGGDIALPHSIALAHQLNTLPPDQKSRAEVFFTAQYNSVTAQASSNTSIYGSNWGTQANSTLTFNAPAQIVALGTLVSALQLPEIDPQTPTASPSSSPALPVDRHDASHFNALIAGAIIGGICVLALVLTVTVFAIRRKRQRRKNWTTSHDLEHGSGNSSVEPYPWGKIPGPRASASQVAHSRSDSHSDDLESRFNSKRLGGHLRQQSEAVTNTTESHSGSSGDTPPVHGSNSSQRQLSTEEVVRLLYQRMHQSSLEGEAPPDYRTSVADR